MRHNLRDDIGVESVDVNIGEVWDCHSRVASRLFLDGWARRNTPRVFVYVHLDRRSNCLRQKWRLGAVVCASGTKSEKERSRSA